MWPEADTSPPDPVPLSCTTDPAASTFYTPPPRSQQVSNEIMCKPVNHYLRSGVRQRSQRVGQHWEAAASLRKQMRVPASH